MSLNQIQTQNLGAVSDGSVPSTAIAGRYGEQIVSELHGKFATVNYRQRMFMANTLTAGTTIPIQATNLVSTFTLWNPLGSGVFCELVRYTCQILAATTVVSEVSLYMQSAVGTNNTAPGTLTALAIRPCYWAQTASIAPVATNSAVNFYSAATLVNTMATNMFRGPTLAGFAAVTSTSNTPAIYDFDGSILIGPGTLVTTAGAAAQTSAAAQSLSWIEWPAP